MSAAQFIHCAHLCLQEMIAITRGCGSMELHISKGATRHNILPTKASSGLPLLPVLLRCQLDGACAPLHLPQKTKKQASIPLDISALRPATTTNDACAACEDAAQNQLADGDDSLLLLG